MDEDCLITKEATAIFTEQFLTFLTAVQIALSNDAHLRAKMMLVFSDLQKFFQDKGLSAGQIVSVLSTFVVHTMHEKHVVNSPDMGESFM